jgi:hypothetical protein
MNNNYLIDLIKYGNLIDLKIGQNKDHIKSIIKDKPSILSLSDTSDLWSYDLGLELYIEGDKLINFTIKYNAELEGFKLPSCYKVIKDNCLDKLSSIDFLIDVLKENNIEWEMNKNLCDDENICISCNGITDIYYNLESHYIYSIHSRGLDWWIQENNTWSGKNQRSF